jgi:hypothetical protein
MNRPCYSIGHDASMRNAAVGVRIRPREKLEEQTITVRPVKIVRIDEPEGAVDLVRHPQGGVAGPGRSVVASSAHLLGELKRECAPESIANVPFHAIAEGGAGQNEDVPEPGTVRIEQRIVHQHRAIRRHGLQLFGATKTRGRPGRQNRDGRGRHSPARTLVSAGVTEPPIRNS